MSSAIQALFFYLANPIDATQTSIQVRGLKDSRGNSITAMPSGITTLYATIEPRSSINQESISFTGITDNGNGLVTLTGVTRNLNPQPPYTALSPLVPHGSNAECILSNSPGFYSKFPETDKAAVITADWQVPMPVNANSIASKAYADSVGSAGAADAKTDTKGISKLTAASLTTLGTATITIASPAVVSFTAHGLIAGDKVRFSTTGALPTGLVAGTDYYVISTGLTANSFQLSATPGGTAIVTTGTQSGVHTLICTTPYSVGRDDPKLPTQSENDAMVGKSGSPVGSNNKFVDEAMLSTGSTTDQSQATQNTALKVGEADATTKNRRIAQSFVAGKTPIQSVKLWKKANTGTFVGDVVVSIQADNAGNPSGVSLASVTILNAVYNALTAETEFTATFASALTLTLGSTYWIVVTPSTADNANYMNLGYQNTNVYASGLLKSYNTTDGHTAVTGDLYFVTVINPNGQVATVDSNNKLGAYDASNLLNITKLAENYTASGDIVANDTVYPTASGVVKKFIPTGMNTGASITTSPSHKARPLHVPLATAGKYLHVSGGSNNNSNILYAQIRTLNAAETDFANGTEQIIYNTGNGTRWFDICPIGTDKFLIIFQADTAGAAAGIKCVVVSVNTGTDTITVGAVQGIETTGNFSYQPTCVKVDVDKAAIFYQKDSDSKPYVQILTVSGTTITTNTPVLLKNSAQNWNFVGDQISTNNIVILYNGSSTVGILGMVISVSGTTPTLNTEQTVYSSGTINSANLGFKLISATKGFLIYSENNTPTNDTCLNVAISGITITGSSSLALGSNRATSHWTPVIIGTKYALVNCIGNASGSTLYLLDISGTAPTSVANQGLGSSAHSSIYVGSVVIKISPWTYMVDFASISDSDYIVKLIPPTVGRIGLAAAAILDTAIGSILYRFLMQTLTGITLTPGSNYYVDDNAQPTVNTSLTAPTLGVAVTASKILLY